MKKQKQDKKKKQETKKRNNSFNLFNWENIRIGYKYLISFSVVIALFLVATIIVYIQLDTVKKDVNTIIDQNELSNDLAQIALYIEQKDSYVSSYILISSSRDVELYEEASKELNELLQKVEPHFSSDEDIAVYNRIKENSTDIDDLFLNSIINPEVNHDNRIITQIQIGTKKTSSVALINRLIDEMTEEQSIAVTRTNDSLTKSNIYLAVANILSILVGSIIVLLIGRNISNNLSKVVQTASEIARGNLAIKSTQLDGRDEIGQLTRAVNLIRQNTVDILTEVTNASQSVTNRSKHLTQSAKEVQLGSEQVAVTMDELASAAETQATGASNLSGNMQHFVSSILSSQQDGQNVAKDSEHVLTLTSDGSNLMKQSVSQMERIDMIVADAVDKVRGLDEQSDKISHLVSVVKDIADQTNLLSLNAAIEAARAGEHGQGFAVVANEVRQLAEEVTQSVTEITNIVNNIQSETSTVVSSLNDGYKEVEEGIVQIEKTGQNFEVIDSSITEMSERISRISTNLNDVAENSEEMNKLIEDIAAVSEEAAAGVEQSAASTQETTSAMDEVTRNANELEELAQVLNKEIARFRLS